MLGLINNARREHGVSPVALGNNNAAQEHAYAMLEGNFVGHWGLDGLNSTMRYTLAGGTGYVQENTIGAVLTDGVNYRKRARKEILTESHTSLMGSTGHRDNVLDKWHTAVNLGIACNEITCSIVQDFERNYVTFNEKPTISNGILSFDGELKDDFELHSIQVWYHQPPHPLTLGQLDATYSVSIGQEPATFLLKPAPPGFHWSQSDLLPVLYSWTTGTDPYNVDPKQQRRVRTISGIALPYPRVFEQRTALVPWTVADTWQLSGSAFEIKADISAVIDEQEAGVYTVVIWGEHSGEKIPLTNYSVFVEA